jgi:hypothetical protein
MIEILDADTTRVGAYVAAAGASMWVAWKEHRRSDGAGSDWWLAYWLVSGGVLTLLGLALAVDVAELVRDLGRTGARSDGWYGARSTYQVAALAALVFVWLSASTVVLIALWRVRVRRRRYLPHAVAMVTLMAFVAIRLVSLHEVDALLYGRALAGARWGVLAELALIGTTVLLSFRCATFPRAEESP